jgi:hypothetical protein
MGNNIKAYEVYMKSRHQGTRSYRVNRVREIRWELIAAVALAWAIARQIANKALSAAIGTGLAVLIATLVTA